MTIPRIKILVLTVAALSSIVLFSTTVFADSGLELHWDLNEGSGAVAVDSSGNNNGGTIFNSPPYVAGKEGQALSLNGIDQYALVDAPLTSLGTMNEPYALSAWVKVPTGVSAGNIVHISSNPDGSGWCIPFLRLQSNAFRATGWDLNGEVIASSPTSVVADQWYQVLTSWDATNGLRLFVDGVLVDQTAQSDHNAPNTPLYISVGLGSNSCSGDQGFLQGTVDDVRIYKRVLGTSDITNINNFDVPTAVQEQTTTTLTQAAAPKTTLADTGQTTSLVNMLSLGMLLVSGLLIRRVTQGRQQNQ